MGSAVLKQVVDLRQMDLAGLRGRWRELFGSEPPGYSRELMARRLACRIQELALGGISEGARVELSAALDEAGMDADGRVVTKHRRGPPVDGTRLIREYKGQRYEVTVVDGGYEYQGRRYKSLSVIARLITGTQWNGPMFFGLRQEPAS